MKLASIDLPKDCQGHTPPCRNSLIDALIIIEVIP